MDVKRIIAPVLLAVVFAGLGRTQTLSTAAGNSTWKSALGVTVDVAGNLYVADYVGSTVYMVDPLGHTTRLAGTGAAGYSGDGGQGADAQINGPAGVAIDSTGIVYIAEYGGQRIRAVDLNGIITTFAGTGAAGFLGEGGPAVDAQLSYPYHVAVDGSDNVYVSERGNARIRMVDIQTGIIQTIIGTGKLGDSGDGGPALLADIDPAGFQVMSDGSIYFTNDGAGSYGGDGLRTVRLMTPDQTVSLVAGSGQGGNGGDGGLATDATFSHPLGVAVDGSGNVFISDFGNDVIREVTPDGTISTYAGNGTAGAGGDGGDPTSGQFNGPSDLAVDSYGDLFIADYFNHRVREVETPLTGPSISSNNSGTPAFEGQTGFSSNDYLQIYGTDLAQTTRSWGGADFDGPNAPTSLDGVSVTVNGLPAFVYYVSPTQININTPDDTATGLVQIQVQNNDGTSNVGSVMRATVSPALQTVPQFAVGGKQYVVAQTPDFSAYIGRPNLLAGVNFVPASPGDTVIIYALGCGPTNPGSPAGVVAAQNSPLTSPFQVQIGGVRAQVDFAGIAANTIGLYQFNVVIPNVAAGDQPIGLTVGGVQNAQNLVITVGQ